MTYRIGSRRSALAMYQSELVQSMLAEICPTEVVGFATDGDNQSLSLSSAGSAGIFVNALRAALVDGRADLVVHSLKDLPTYADARFTLAAIPQRIDVQDVFIARGGLSVNELPEGAVVGTSSPRRSVWIKQLRPDVEVRPIRGNVETRLRKVADGEFDATILAFAGLKRLGLLTEHMHVIDLEELTPAPGQAALAVECRSEDAELIELLRLIDDSPARLCVTAERTVLRTLSASCATAAGAYAFIDDRGLLNLTADVSSVETTEQIRVQVAMPVADEMAAVALGEMVANELIEDGAYELIGETRG